ncbi:Pr6Pr family membrane protein [Brevundimonas sp. SL130]|uniref:Pr6Pr family membrane protein n=1 Tax=Brevundimonas sp. SL130 TaxID=2995143 RepID=UPI00226CE945|nr:Pr6Pr family membrane protein [Brevundimonas sp. SL130]WAC61037.1 Pr6Pr family membrane protein [Brevundimonas sp. SL130]
MLRERDRPRLWRAAFAVIGWAALALQYLLMAAPADGWAVMTRTVQYFSFFTILSNILVAGALTGPLLKPTRPLARWTASPAFRAAVTTYILTVGVVYHFMIAPYWRPEGLTLGVNLVLHYVMPVAFLLDWLWFTPKGELRWIDPVKALGVPLIFGVWTLVHGLATHWWPYRFVNVDALGLGRVLAIFAVLLGVFLLVGLALVGLDRVFGRTRRDSSAPAL